MKNIFPCAAVSPAGNHVTFCFASSFAKHLQYVFNVSVPPQQLGCEPLNNTESCAHLYAAGAMGSVSILGMSDVRTEWKRGRL